MFSLWNSKKEPPASIPAGSKPVKPSRPTKKVAFAFVESESESDAQSPPAVVQPMRRPKGRKPSARLERQSSSIEPLGAISDAPSIKDPHDDGRAPQALRTRLRARPPQLDTAYTPILSSGSQANLQIQTKSTTANPTTPTRTFSQLQVNAEKLKQFLTHSPGIVLQNPNGAFSKQANTFRDELRVAFSSAALSGDLFATNNQTVTPTLNTLPMSAGNTIIDGGGRIDLKYVKQDKSQQSHIRLIDHPNHSRGEAGDDHYEQTIKSLYKQVDLLVETYYCSPNPLPECYDLFAPENSPWNSELGENFLSYVELIAGADPYTGGWDRLMVDVKQRKAILIGVIAQILQTKIFNELLFGTNQYEQEMLELMEKTLVNKDGYERTHLRACTTRTLLGNAALPQGFDVAVAKLSAQTLKMLEPLFLHSQRIHDKYPHLPRPSIDNLMQDLNDVFSQAGYLSLTMRHSDTIFSFISVRPNEPWDDKLHHCIDVMQFTKSKENVMRSLSTAAHAGLRSNTNFMSTVGISVWPIIQRHKPGNGLAGGEKSGFRIFDICKAGTSVYWGTTDRRGKRELRLREWLTKRRAGRKLSSQGCNSIFGWIIFILLLGALVHALAALSNAEVHKSLSTGRNAEVEY